MKRKNIARNALFTSIISLMLCISMLVGTTFAWFTDSVVSGNNVIAAGNLDVELYHSNKAVQNEKVNGETELFSDIKLWEPGVVVYENFVVANEGNLALKYQLSINITDETVVNGHGLSEALKVAVVEGGFSGDRAAAHALWNTQSDKVTFYDLASFVLSGELEGTEKSNTYGIVIYWEPTDNDNLFNLKDVEKNEDGSAKNPLSITMGVNLFATQEMYEDDSFGNDYDENAWDNAMVVTSEADLNAAIANGETAIMLGADVALADGTALTIAADKSIAMNLNGYELSGNNTKDSGAIIVNNGTLSIYGGEMINNVVNGAAVIDNKGTLTLDGVTVKSAPMGATEYPDYAVTTSGKLTVEEGTSIVADRGAIRMSAGAEVVIKGGSFTVSNAADGRNMTLHTIYAYGSGSKLTIYDGYFEQNHTSTGGASVICPAGATIDIYGGDFRDAMDDTNWQSTGNFQNYMGYSAPVNVYGGTFDDTTVNKNLASGYKAVQNADGTYTVLKGDVVAGDDTALNDALTSGKDNIALGAGNFTMPGTSGDVTITGTKDTVISITTPTANKVTLNGVTVVAGSYKGIQHSDTVVFENCTLKGTQFLYAKNVVIKNCIIDLTEVADYIWTYSAKNVTFEGCTFNTLGKAILIYHEGFNTVTNVTVKDCTFNATANEEKAAIEIDSSNATSGHYTLTTENNTYNSDNFSGEWRVKKSGTNNTTVNGEIYNRVEDGLYKSEGVEYYVYNANGLAALNQLMANKTAGRDVVVNLIADIDFSGKTWTPVDSHADTAFEIAEINGNGHTISNLTINGQAMFTRFAGSGDVVVKDITFDKATVNSTALNTSILTVHTYQNVLLDNVDVKNSTITGSYKVAPLIATVYNESSSTITATLKNCDVSNTTVHGNLDFMVAGMVAFVYENDNDKIVFENCTVTDVTLSSSSKGYNAVAAIYCNDGDAAGSFDEATGVTVTNVTKN